ncbi:LysE family translocator [Sneathiella marina]|uniref:LysE family translocator n=1 Tax=Sneathiella marina TaxID=2950108 RepID=A0ABY4W5R3_9PROT|nr:LysE family translocator [Sneathiella marina]USG62259.1 LysE family translocator [Sneathiella marina]
MTFEHILAFNLAVLAAIASPGPAMLVAIRTTLTSGRRAGLAIGAGLGLVAALWTLAALLGLEALFKIFPWAYTAAKVGGAVYLLYVAVRMWAGARQRLQPAATPTTHAFRQGLMINLLNPKSVLFAAAVLIVIFPAGLSPIENAFIVVNHLLVEIICYSTLAAVMSTPAISGPYLKAKIYIDRVAAVILGLLGIRLITDR